MGFKSLNYSGRSFINSVLQAIISIKKNKCAISIQGLIKFNTYIQIYMFVMSVQMLLKFLKKEPVT